MSISDAMGNRGRRSAFGALCCLILICALTAIGPARAETSYRDALAEGRQAMDRGDLRVAEIRMRDAVRTYPSNPDVHLMLAQVLLKLGNSPDAEEEARLARWYGGPDNDTAPVLAQALLQQNKLGQLIQVIQPGGRDMKAEASVRLALGLAHLGLGETDIGETLLRDAQRLDPTGQQSDLGMARLYMAKNDYPSAARELAAARAIDPDAIDVLRLQADLQRSTGDVEGALASYDTALKTHPGDLGLLVGHAMILISLERLSDAQIDIDAALDQAPYSLTPNFLKGLLQARAGKLKEADDTLVAISGGFDALPNGYYVLGAVQYALGQNESAIDNFAHFIARRPDHLGARRLLARSAMRMHDPLRAIQALQPIAYDDPTDRETLELYAQVLIAAGRKNDAIELYDWAARTGPDDPRVKTQAALLQMRLGDPIAGSDALEKVATSASGLEVAGPILVLDELQNGQLDKAATAAERLAASTPNDAVARNMLGTVRVAQLRFADAEQIFAGIVARDPSDIVARRNLAHVYAATDRPAEAQRAYDAVLKLKPNDLPSFLALADIASAMGKPGDAADWLIKARAAAPNSLEPVVQLVRLYVAQKAWDKALTLANDLRAKAQDNTDLLELAAAVHAASGDLPGAIGEYVTFHQRTSATVLTLRRQAAYQLRGGDPDGARQSLRRALDIAPDDEALITEAVNLAYDSWGADAAVSTAHFVASREPELADLLSANALARANRRAEAIQLLRDSMVLRPSSRSAGRLAELVFESGKHQEAKAMVREQLKKYEEIPALMSLANMCMIDGEDSEAEARYERVIQLAPNEPLALNNLAWLYAGAKPQRARELALQAFRTAPSPQSADTLGWILLRGGETETGLPFLERAASALPTDLQVQYHLAAALQASGAKDRARTLLERVVGANSPFRGRDDAERRLKELQHS
jgi:putative PEP-CTERM system TPR-repeat lipoprotein